MKYKFATILFATAVIAISIYATLRPSYDLGLFVDLGRMYARVRILLALGAVSYVLIPILRIKLSQIVMLLGGAVLLGLGITSIFSPLLLGHLSHYTALGDVIMAIEGGTISMLAALQLETKKLRFYKPYLTPSYHLSNLPSMKPTKLISSQQSRTA